MYYKKHLFVCTNQRPVGKASCGNHQASEACSHLKLQTKVKGLSDVRVSSAGCLGRCEEGPVMVVYPQGHWYHYQSQADLDSILEQDLVQNDCALALLLPNKAEREQ